MFRANDPGNKWRVSLRFLIEGTRAPSPAGCAQTNLRKKTRSRFAINAAEGARVPSTKLSLQLKLIHYLGIAVLLFLCTEPAAGQPQTLEQDMIHAVEACDLAKVKALSAQKPELLHVRKTANGNEAPLLHYTVFCTDISVAEFLIAQGADVNELWASRLTATHVAARGNNLALVNLLVAHHADVNAADASGYTPLFTSSAEIAKVLLNHGANPNAVDKEGRTFLHYNSDRR
jgi:hypothetical protein